MIDVYHPSGNSYEVHEEFPEWLRKFSLRYDGFLSVWLLNEIYVISEKEVIMYDAALDRLWTISIVAWQNLHPIFDKYGLPYFCYPNAIPV